MPFQLESNYKPRGDQGQAIAKLTKSLQADNRHQTLLGVTGSGKTFTIANVIREIATWKSCWTICAAWRCKWREVISAKSVYVGRRLGSGRSRSRAVNSIALRAKRSLTGRGDCQVAQPSTSA
jgi:hypothetical protein